MHVGDRTEDGTHNSSGFRLGVGIPGIQIASAAAFHDNRNLTLKLKGFDGSNNIRMIQVFQDGNFVSQFVDKFLLTDLTQQNTFHGINNFLSLARRL